MKYFLVLCTALLSTVKVTCQGRFAKSGVKSTADSVFFNALIFGTAALFFSHGLIFLTPSVLGYAVIYALFTAAFQITYTLALSCGNVSLAVMFANFGTVLPVIASCALGERPSPLRILGITLTMCSLIIVAKPSGGGSGMRTFVLSVTAMLFNGTALTVQKLYTAAKISDNNSAFVACAYVFSALFCLGVYFIMRCRGRRKTFSLGKKPLLWGAASGLALGTFLTVHTFAAGMVEGSFLYPAHSGLSILTSTLSGILLFHDKLSKRQTVSFLLGIAAIILMN